MLREETLKRYISSNAGPHHHLSKTDIDSFCRAYSFYLRDWVPSGYNRSWLDIGCGQGALMKLASKFNYKQIFGIDISEEMLQTCRNNGFDVKHDDIFSYLAQTPDQTWDVISAFDLIEHFTKEEGLHLLKEIHRVLTPDGICFFKLPNAASPWGTSVTASDLTHEAAYTSCSLSQMATLAGFQEYEFREVGPAPVTIVSNIRNILWNAVRLFYQVINMIETGSKGDGIYTRIMIGRLMK
jgi:SAM-dependent methyltransferase